MQSSKDPSKTNGRPPTPPRKRKDEVPLTKKSTILADLRIHTSIFPKKTKSRIYIPGEITLSEQFIIFQPRKEYSCSCKLIKTGFHKKSCLFYTNLFESLAPETRAVAHATSPVSLFYDIPLLTIRKFEKSSIREIKIISKTLHNIAFRFSKQESADAFVTICSRYLKTLTRSLLSAQDAERPGWNIFNPKEEFARQIL
eukprot:snap_masked-scaffold_11-processed-gene-11.22-mRNA-1 protein AED:1.00 eAED:1.00 QI:0/-1/0/0/-1/1/1/0/198